MIQLCFKKMIVFSRLVFLFMCSVTLCSKITIVCNIFECIWFEIGKEDFLLLKKGNFLRNLDF